MYLKVLTVPFCISTWEYAGVWFWQKKAGHRVILKYIYLCQFSLQFHTIFFRLFKDRKKTEQEAWFDAYNEMLDKKKPNFIETYGQGELTNPTLILFNKQYSEEAQPEQNAAVQLQLSMPNGGNPRSSYQSVVSPPKNLLVILNIQWIHQFLKWLAIFWFGIRPVRGWLH